MGPEGLHGKCGIGWALWKWERTIGKSGCYLSPIEPVEDMMIDSNARSQPRELLARVGEHLRCTEGHEIALVARPIAIDAKPEVEDFSSWYIDPPGCAGPVFAICRCPCGSPWARLDDDGNLELRIGFEWRGPRPPSGPQPSGWR